MERIVTMILTVAFAAAFFQYFSERETAVKTIPVALIAIAALISLTGSRGIAARVLREILATSRGAIIVIACVVPLVISAANGSDYAVSYGALLLVLLISIRILLCTVTVHETITAFLMSSFICLPIFLAYTCHGFLESAVVHTRFIPLFFHPNLVAFIAVGYAAVQVWYFAYTGRKKYWVVPFALFSLLIAFFAGSRASLIALAVACGVIAASKWSRNIRSHGLRFRAGGILLTGCALTGLILLIAANPTIAGNAAGYLTDKLDINSQVRGLHSGFSGRTTNWQYVWEVAKHGSWLFGEGFRTSSERIPVLIDNGYLCLFYEIGLVATAVLIAKYFSVLCRSCWRYIANKAGIYEADTLIVTTLLVIFLTNSVFDRLLFSYGDPFSILCLWFLLVSPTEIIPAEANPADAGFPRPSGHGPSAPKLRGVRTKTARAF